MNLPLAVITLDSGQMLRGLDGQLNLEVRALHWQYVRVE